LARQRRAKQILFIDILVDRSYIRITMSLARNKILSSALVLLQVCTIFFVQMGHIHNLPGTPIGLPEIQSHDCGATERHLPLDFKNHCILCQRVSNFVSVIHAIQSTPVVHSRIPNLPAQHYHYSHGTGFYFFKRGPPVLV
jgi:hypothetical protein